jgi:hypothetical protein
MMPAPLASILINNYNYGRFLGQAIDSALSQDYPSKEILVGGPPTNLAKSLSATQTVSFRSSRKTGAKRRRSTLASQAAAEIFCASLMPMSSRPQRAVGASRTRPLRDIISFRRL